MRSSSMRRSYLLTALAVAVVLWLGLSLKGCGGPEPIPLPPVVVRQLEQHHVQSTADSVQQAALLVRARAESVHAAAAQRQAVQATRAAAAQRQRADSLAQVAALRHDSGQAWHAAYDARTLERDALQVALAGAVERGDALEQQLARSDSVGAIERARRQRADSLVASLVPLAERRAEDRCRIARFLPCPTRTQAAIGAAVAVVALSQALPQAHLRIKLPP